MFKICTVSLDYGNCLTLKTDHMCQQLNHLCRDISRRSLLYVKKDMFTGYREKNFSLSYDSVVCINFSISDIDYDARKQPKTTTLKP